MRLVFFVIGNNLFCQLPNRDAITIYSVWRVFLISIETYAILQEKFPGRSISQHGEHNWPPKILWLNTYRLFNWGHVKARVNGSQSIQDGIREAISTTCSCKLAIWSLKISWKGYSAPNVAFDWYRLQMLVAYFLIQNEIKIVFLISKWKPLIEKLVSKFYNQSTRPI